MKPLFSYKDKYGSYSLSFEEQIVSGRIRGALGDTLSKRFLKDMQSIVHNNFVAPWSYLADMSTCEGLTGTAEKKLQETYSYCINSGCVVDAYCVQSPIAIDQIRRIRTVLGVRGDIDNHIFTRLQDAKAFIINVMAKIK